MTSAPTVHDRLSAEEALRAIVADIVGAVHPLAVILFGSRARGDHRPTSDADLLVVMPEGAETRRIRADLYGRLAFAELAKDLVVATPSRLAAARGDYSSVLHWAQEEGITLYDTGG